MKWRFSDAENVTDPSQSSLSGRFRSLEVDQERQDGEMMRVSAEITTTRRELESLEGRVEERVAVLHRF